MPPKSSKISTNKDGPKKNKSSYIFFGIDERKIIKEENLGLSNSGILTEIGVRWKSLKDNNPKRYEYYINLAKEDKIRYENELNNPEKNLSDDTITVKEEKIDKNTKVNGYINYCKKNRTNCKNKYPELNPKEITKKLSEEWKALSNEKKEDYKN